MAHPFALYNPALLPPEVLLSEYSARLPLLETLLGIVRSNQPGHPPQHCLLIGARGMGKTTTLWAVAHKISRDYELARQWQPVVFDEESRRVGDLADFWLEAIRQWEFATKATTDLTGPLLAQNPPDIEDHAHRLFIDLVARSGKRVVLLIDNLNDLLASIRDDEPLHRLRAALMQDSGIMLIGGATSYFEQVTSVDQPFFEFFRFFELKELSLEEMRECLTNLAQSHQDKDVEKALAEHMGSIRALHLLTGGNPRLIKTFYRLLRGGLHTDIRTDLERLLDDYTPYFKAIVDTLPVQQQRIFDAVALAWNPVEVATLATTTRLPSNQVSAQLRTLVKSGLIREALGHPKKKAYLLADRFSNIHYLMRHGRSARSRLDWFVATVHVLFPDKAAELLAKAACDAAECGSYGRRDARDVISSALHRAENTEARQRLLHLTLQKSWRTIAAAEIEGWLDVECAKADLPEIDIIAFCQRMPSEIRQQIDYQPDAAHWWSYLADFLCSQKAFKLAARALVQSLKIDPQQADVGARLGDLLSIELGLHELAEKVYRNVVTFEASHAWSWDSLGYLYLDHLNRLEEAEEAFYKSLAANPTDEWSMAGIALVFERRHNQPDLALDWIKKALSIRPSFTHGWVQLARLQHKSFHNYRDAEFAYMQSIDIDPEFVTSWRELAWLRSGEMKKYLDARPVYEKWIQLAPNDAWAYNDYGNLLMDHLNQPKEAEQMYLRAAELAPDEACCWQNLGSLYMQYLEFYEKAEMAYSKAIQLDPTWAPPHYGLGQLYQYELKNLGKAEQHYREAVKLDPSHADAWLGLAEALDKSAAGKGESLDCVARAIQLDPEDSHIRNSFLAFSLAQKSCWQNVLPQLFEWCLTHPKITQVFDFVIDGVVRYAQLTDAQQALHLFVEVSDATPFESIQDALKACGDREHLHRLAPERQAVALELMKRIQKPQDKSADSLLG